MVDKALLLRASPTLQVLHVACPSEHDPTHELSREFQCGGEAFTRAMQDESAELRRKADQLNELLDRSQSSPTRERGLSPDNTSSVRPSPADGKRSVNGVQRKDSPDSTMTRLLQTSDALRADVDELDHVCVSPFSCIQEAFIFVTSAVKGLAMKGLLGEHPCLTAEEALRIHLIALRLEWGAALEPPRWTQAASPALARDTENPTVRADASSKACYEQHPIPTYVALYGVAC